MKWTADIIYPKALHFVIHQTVLRNAKPGKPDRLGFYLYVYENGRGIYDYLQDTLDIAKSFALEEFQVPYDAWHTQKDA